MENVDLRNKSYKQFLGKNESGPPRIFFIFDFFFQLKFFLGFFCKFLNILCLD